MRIIDADELQKVKFHALPYTHIVPSDLKGLQTEAYERGWNDAIDAIVENAETADVVERKRGKWSHDGSKWANRFICSECGYKLFDEPTNYCPNCGARMDKKGGADEETR